MATFTFNKARVKGAVRKSVREALFDEAKLIRTAIKAAISIPGPEPSLPGNPPHLQTGNLHGSIDVWMSPTGLKAAVTANVDALYWSDLEFGTAIMEARPFVQVTVDAMQDAIEADMQVAFAHAMATHKGRLK